VEVESTTPTKTNSSKLQHMPYTGVIGILQRLTLCSPDRVNTRALAAQSIVLVIAQLHKSSAAPAPETAEGSSITMSDRERLSIQQYFDFLLKLSTCNKVGLRAFAMEIISVVLVADWIWQQKPTPEDITGEAAVALPKALLLTLIDR
jgi:hypothetical protein